MKIRFRNKFLSAVVLGIFVFGCSSIDLSTPEKNVDTLYYAISNKDVGLYAKCFYEHGELNTSEIKLAARYILTHFKILKHEIIQKETVKPDEVKFTLEEVLQKDTGLKFKSKFIVMFIKVGGEWKILNTKGIETKKIE